MIRRVEIQMFDSERPETALVAIGETVKHDVVIPSGNERDDIYFFFKNKEDFLHAFDKEDASFIEDSVEGRFCDFVILEDIECVSEDDKWVVVNWCADPDEDAAGCFDKYFHSQDEAVKFLRENMIEFINENEIDLCDVNTDVAGDGCYKSVDEIPYSDNGSLWWGDVRHYWQVQHLHENF